MEPLLNSFTFSILELNGVCPVLVPLPSLCSHFFILSIVNRLCSRFLPCPVTNVCRIGRIYTDADKKKNFGNRSSGKNNSLQLNPKRKENLRRHYALAKTDVSPSMVSEPRWHKKTKIKEVFKISHWNQIPGNLRISFSYFESYWGSDVFFVEPRAPATKCQKEKDDDNYGLGSYYFVFFYWPFIGTTWA